MNMETCKDRLRIIYSLHLHRGGKSILNIESDLNLSPEDLNVSDDDIRNERFQYEALFQDPCASLIERIFDSEVGAMISIPYDQCSAHLEALEFIQEIASTAMWKFGTSIPSALEDFAREFDRLDVEEERHRLYLLAQEKVRNKPS
jgi:hypothetical protein